MTLWKLQLKRRHKSNLQELTGLVCANKPQVLLSHCRWFTIWFGIKHFYVHTLYCISNLSKYHFHLINTAKKCVLSNQRQNSVGHSVVILGKDNWCKVSTFLTSITSWVTNCNNNKHIQVIVADWRLLLNRHVAGNWWRTHKVIHTRRICICLSFYLLSHTTLCNQHIFNTSYHALVHNLSADK